MTPSRQEAAGTPTVPSAAELLHFLQTFSSCLLACASPTMRVDRNAQRIAHTYGYDVELALFPKHLMITVMRPDGQHQTSVASIQAGGPHFRKLAALNALGWQIVDERLELDEAWRRLEAIMALPAVNQRWLRLFVACANAAFCRLFDGDAVAMLLVFLATLGGFCVRQFLHKRGLDGKMVFLLSAFAASLLASPGVIWGLGQTPQTALAASVLFLIPGIPLINAMHDILDGHVLMGLARFVQAGILIVCIALGLSLTMLLLGVNLR